MHRLLAGILLIAVGVLNGATLGAQADSARASQLGPDESRLRGFVITLVLGDTEPGTAPKTFTPAAAKALADMTNFLPYKMYRPLDTAWVVGLTGPHLFLTGLNGQKHEFHMRSTLMSSTVAKVDLLRLWDAAPPAGPKTATQVLIDTSFKIEVGETVVVGTSRVDGGRALLLLVTAEGR